MARMNEIDNNQAVNEILGEVQEAFGMLPKLWTLYANHPALLKANWEKQKLIMNEGLLSAKLKQAIALSVSVANSCQYCVDAHKMMLESMGVNSEDVEKNEYEKAGFSKKESLLLEFSNEVNSNAYKIEDKLFKVLRENSCSDAEILEALGVVELYVGYNLFLNTLDVEGGSL